jgi:glycosyltransferase involved in cell wall biosynthesis
MRIALVHPFSWPEVRRGGERYLDDLAVYLAGRGHAVEIVTGTDGPSTVERRPDGVVVRRRHHLAPVRLQSRGVSRVDSFGAPALPVLARERYEIVHAFTPSAAIAGRLAGRRVVYTVLGHPSAGQFGKRPGDYRIMRRAVRSATVPVALSTASASACQALFGPPVDVLPPGVRGDRFEPDRSPRRGRPRLLFSADAEDPRKGLATLLAAMVPLLRARPDAQLVLSGPGDHRPALAGLGRDADRVASAVEPLGLGDLDDVGSRYRAATVTVLPSTLEAFGLALVESLSCGTPVVCSDDGGMPDIAGRPEDGVGFVVPPQDPDALAAALDQAIDLAGRADTADRCVARARQWDWDAAIGPRHEALYESVVSRSRARSGSR